MDKLTEAEDGTFHATPRFSTSFCDEVYPALVCPCCSEHYLHHGTITVFDRGEDDERGLATTLNDGSVRVVTDLAGNPSSRRDGMRIQFWCEYSQRTDIALVIQQHKGATLMYWECGTKKA